MLMKSHKFVIACFAVMLFLTTVACSANNSATRATAQNASATKAVDEKPARTFDCRNASQYGFVEVENPNRKRDSDPVIPKDLNIVVGDEVISKIELPMESEVKNFSLNSIEKNNAGFEIQVNWGGALDHFEILFNFKCKENNFYLDEIRKESLSTTNPNSGNFLNKKDSKTTKIEPNLPIQRFVMLDFL